MASLLSTPWTFTVARFARSPNSHQQGPRGRGKHSRQPTGARAREPDPGRRSGPVRRHSGRREAENSTADVQNDRRAGAKSGIGRRTGCHSPPEIGSLRRGRGGCLFRLEDVVKLPDRGVCIAKLGAHSALSLTTPQPGSRDVRLPATMRNNTRKQYFPDSCLAQTKAIGIIGVYEQKKKSNKARDCRLRLHVSLSISQTRPRQSFSFHLPKHHHLLLNRVRHPPRRLILLLNRPMLPLPIRHLLILLYNIAAPAATRLEDIRAAVALEVVLVADIGALHRDGDGRQTQHAGAAEEKALSIRTSIST